MSRRRSPSPKLIEIRQKLSYLSEEDSFNKVSSACEYTYADSRSYRRFSPVKRKCPTPDLKRSPLGTHTNVLLSSDFSPIQSLTPPARRIRQSRYSERYFNSTEIGQDDVSLDAVVPNNVTFQVSKPSLLTKAGSIFSWVSNLTLAGFFVSFQICQKLWDFSREKLSLWKTKISSFKFFKPNDNPIMNGIENPQSSSYREKLRQIVRHVRNVTIEETILNGKENRASVLLGTMRPLAGGPIISDGTKTLASAKASSKLKTCCWIFWILASIVGLLALALPWLVPLLISKDVQQVPVGPVIQLDEQKITAQRDNNLILALMDLIKKREEENFYLKRRFSSMLSRISSLESSPDKHVEKLNGMDARFAELNATLTRLFLDKNADFNLLHEQLYGNMQKQSDQYAYRLQDLYSQIAALSNRSCNCSAVSKSDGTKPDGNILKTVQLAIKDAIETYDADKIGLPDFALEPAGGSILDIGCTETYESGTRLLSWSWVPLWFVDYSPRTIIQPGVSPGTCWSFKGHRGQVMIKLSRTIRITGVSYEHIRKSVSPDGKIDSAPKKMQILGLTSKSQETATLLANFTYDDNGSALQYFAIEDPPEEGFPIVELKILSNHGHPMYTCLYRFRVHGIPVDSNPNPR